MSTVPHTRLDALMNFRIKFHKNPETMLIALGHLVNNGFAIPQKTQKKQANKKTPNPTVNAQGLCPVRIVC